MNLYGMNATDMINAGCWLFMICHAQKISKLPCDAGASTPTYQGNNQSEKTHTHKLATTLFFARENCSLCSMHYMHWGEDTHTHTHYI